MPSRPTALLCLASLLLLGCTINERTDGILELTADAAEGSVVYEAECARCHAADGTGTDEGVNIISELHHGDRLFVTWILDGKGEMPAFPELTDQEVADLMAHIHALAEG
jgi:mono/diheme cytochrome c family protein